MADLAKLVHDYARALEAPPEPLAEQQRHFALVVPKARENAVEALREEFSERELVLLAEILREMTEDPLESWDAYDCGG